MTPGRRGWNLTGPDKPLVRGEQHPSWKGAAASVGAKRERAQRRYPLGVCATCGEPATERHHIDGDVGNNTPLNIKQVCRRCHMREDGRLDRFMSTSASRRGPQPAKPCVNCGRSLKPRRNGRCHACNEYRRRRGVERPYTHGEPSQSPASQRRAQSGG